MSWLFTDSAVWILVDVGIIFVVGLAVIWITTGMDLGEPPV